MGCGSSSGASGALANQTRQQQQWTNQAIGGINQAFSGFDPQYYKGIQNAYMQYARPQLQQQYQATNQGLGFKQARQGLTNSSAATQAQNALSGQMLQNTNLIGNQAVDQANQQKQAVEQQRANLIGQAQQTSDPSAVTSQALGLAGSMAAPSSFAPIGNMFGQFGQLYLANQNANTYNQFAQQYLNNPASYGGSVQGLPKNIYRG